MNSKSHASGLGRLQQAASIVLVAVLTACAATPLPTEMPEGLELVPGTELDTVYLRPGVDFGAYTEFGVEPCEVSFRKNWLRDQNTNRIDLTNRVTQQDVDRIRDALAAECDRYFREVMQQSTRYRLVESFDDGEAVLVVRPAIVNLDVAAPELRGAARTDQYTTSAGEMTLLLEVDDGTTGQLLARVSDRQRDPDFGRLEWANAVTNRSDAARILRRWMGQLREGFERLEQLQ